MDLHTKLKILGLPPNTTYPVRPVEAPGKILMAA